jgi:hypothetical protein
MTALHQFDEPFDEPGPLEDENAPTLAGEDTPTRADEDMRDPGERTIARGGPVADDDVRAGKATRSDATSLFEDADALRREWESVQVRFVDDPRGAVQDADLLVSEAIEQLTASFDAQRERLAALWSGEASASTDELRAAFATYRDFFNRLLSV